MPFGKRDEGGRRFAKRESVPLSALLSTRTRTYSVSAVDLSTTGARLNGAELPEIGTELRLKLENLDAFATVCWRRASECGIEFDYPLSGPEVDKLREEVARAAGMSADLKDAYDHWRFGQAR